jgi:outer membrane biosynthesis protein TonB
VYRRDLLLGRIKARRRNFQDAFAFYEKAVESLAALNSGVSTPATASLYLEIGGVAEQAKDEEKAEEMYKKAYRVFMKLKMPDSAKMIEGKLPNGLDLESEGEESEKEPEPAEAVIPRVSYAGLTPEAEPEAEPVPEPEPQPQSIHEPEVVTEKVEVPEPEPPAETQPEPDGAPGADARVETSFDLIGPQAAEAKKDGSVASGLGLEEEDEAFD